MHESGWSEEGSQLCKTLGQEDARAQSPAEKSKADRVPVLERRATWPVAVTASASHKVPPKMERDRLGRTWGL